MNETQINEARVKALGNVKNLKSLFLLQLVKIFDIVKLKKLSTEQKNEIFKKHNANIS